jgi:hypothetical protein
MEQITAEDVLKVQNQTQMTPQVDAQAATTEAQTKNQEASTADQFAEKFALITKKERQLFQKEQRLKELQDKIQRYEYLEKLKNENPLQFLKEINLDLESTLIQAAKAGEPPTVDDKLSKLEAEIQRLQNMLKEKEEFEAKVKEEKAIATFKQNLRNHIQAKPDDYELIIANDAFETVFDVIDAHYQKTQKENGEGEILDFDKAAQLVENYLLENSKKAIRTKKLSQLLAQSQQKEPTFKSTISGSMTPVTTKPSAGRLLPPEEAIRQIAEQFKNRQQ